IIKTGIKGLDEILKGGLIPERFYLVRGGPGTGKTTLGLHFLIEGLKNNESSLFVSMTEDIEKIKENGKNFGFPIDEIEYLDLSPKSDFVSENKDYDLFSSSQMEQKPLIEKLTKKIKKIKPDRIFFDGFTQLKYLTSDDFKFRKQILSFMQFVKKFNSTILLTSEVGQKNADDDLQFMVDGIISIEYNSPIHSLEIIKYRGSSFNKGKHTLKFKDKGIEIYPKLEVSDYKENYSVEQLSSGVAEINKLLHGGIEKGTSTIITGPSGVGKTTLGTQYIKESAENGLKSIIYSFEESYRTLTKRSKSVNIPLDKIEEENDLIIKRVNPLEYTPEEFSYEVRKDVEVNNASIVLLDSITGYFLSFRNFNDDYSMVRGLHALCEFLKSKGVTVLMINEMKNITGDFQATDSNTSYLADNIIFLRYIEVNGRLEKAIGVLKKRMSDFENTMRKFKITNEGIKVGKPLTEMRGILSGNPEIMGTNLEGE
ncbi:MAG: ATPase domain-containing protein, partial [Bacillota bacterium]